MSVPRIGVNLTWLVPGVVGGSEEATTDLLRGVAALNDHEVEAYKTDAASIKDLANSITNSPTAFLDRRV